ncbi:MAG: hypothetical protein K2W96_09650 [Gemmataceae bacterium]|nr:hypothetical protein [Gemmataceae bacterium]
MIPSRILVSCCAFALLVGAAPAADVPAQPACWGHRAGYRSCYDPQERVGPIRRMWRALFRTPCPCPCPQPAPAAVGFPVAPAPAACPESPRVEIGRPVAPPPLPEAPPPSPPGPFTGSSRAPVAPPRSDLKFERMASREAREPVPVVRGARAESGTRVLLIHAERTTVRHRLLTDERGGLTADLAPGEWLVYSQNAEGALTFRGKVRADEGRPVRVDLAR